MDMEFLATNSEYHTVVFQHMKFRLLALLSNHFYLIQWLEPIKYHSDIDFLDNRLQIHGDSEVQYLIQHDKLYSQFRYQLYE